MCHNHSHLAGYVTEGVPTDQFAVHTVVLAKPLAVEMPTGERLTLPSSTTLFALVPLPGTLCSPELRQTVAHFIASFVAGQIEYGSAHGIPRFSKIGSSE